MTSCPVEKIAKIDGHWRGASGDFARLDDGPRPFRPIVNGTTSPCTSISPRGTLEGVLGGGAASLVTTLGGFAVAYLMRPLRRDCVWTLWRIDSGGVHDASVTGRHDGCHVDYRGFCRLKLKSGQQPRGDRPLPRCRRSQGFLWTSPPTVLSCALEVR